MESTDIGVHDYFCVPCGQVVSLEDMDSHLDEKHDGRNLDEVWPIYKEDGEYVAESEEMGHFVPHEFIETGMYDSCALCGAIRLDGEVEV